MLNKLTEFISNNPTIFHQILLSIKSFSTYLGHSGDWYTNLGTLTLAHKTTLFNFSFFSCTLRKMCWIPITDSTMYPNISKLFRRQKYRQKTKRMGQKDIKMKEEITYENVFIDLNTLIMQIITFTSLRTCSHLLNNINSLHYFMLFLLYYFKLR